MKILVAKDEAFNFTYRANIDQLRTHGEVQFFSPLHDSELPPCDMLYLPGGYPELFAKELAENTTMRQSIKDYAESGGKVFAECGGFMYLCQDIDGTPMCGVLPLQATMEGARLHLGYRQMTWKGKTIKGHEFHYSSIKPSSTSAVANWLRRAEGSSLFTFHFSLLYEYKNVLAGYTHWYWADHDSWNWF